MNHNRIANTKCALCNEEKLIEVLDLGNHPLCDDLSSSDQIRKNNEYPIKINLCTNCLTAHQQYNVKKEILFNDDYHYRSRFTSDVVNGVKDLVEKITSNFVLNKGTWLDVGCNDGTLLDFAKKIGFKTIGIEPTNAAFEAQKRGHTVFKDYLSSQLANKIRKSEDIDVISFTNVFAHIEDFDELIDSVKVLISNNTILVVENHSLNHILDKNQFDTFYHEHPRTYSEESFKWIAQRLNLNIIEISYPSRYGGNIRVVMGNGKQIKMNDISSNSYLNRFKNMDKFIKKWKIEKKNEIQKLVDLYGPLRAKAFPGRAAILIKLLDLDNKSIKEIYEKDGSNKIGYYVPMSDIPIISDNEFSWKLDEPIVNFAWHINKEIQNYMRDRGFKGEIIDIL